MALRSKYVGTMKNILILVLKLHSTKLAFYTDILFRLFCKLFKISQGLQDWFATMLIFPFYHVS